MSSSRNANSAERLQAILDAAVDGIITIDERGTIESANHAAVAMFGYGEEELIGSNVSKLMPEPFRHEHDGYLENYRTTGEAKIIGVGRDVVGQRKCGETFPMNLAVGEVQVSGGRLFTGIVRDLTRESDIKAELAEREQQIQFMVENLPAGAIYLDTIKGLTYCNRAMEEMTGYSAAELATLQSLFSCLFGDRIDEEWEIYQTAIANGSSNQRLTRVQTAAGDSRLFEFTCYRYDHHEVWLIHDITEKHEAAESIRSERDFVRTLLETAQALIAVVDCEGKIVRTNQASERLVGTHVGGLDGRLWNDIFCINESQSPCDEVLGRLLQGERIEGRLATLRSNNGMRHEVLWWARVLDNVGQSGEFAVLFGQDITEFRYAQERALQAERLAAIGQMVTGLAHESRNALQRAQAGMDVLALDVPESQKPIVDKVGAAITHVYRLYDEVRDYAAPIQLQIEPISLQTVWDRAWRAVVETSEISVGLQVVVSSDVDLVCEVDPYRIEQVFRNIFENALAVSADGDVITVDALRNEGRNRIELTVTDSGPGFSSEQKANVFEPFYTTKQRGTGLGMAIVARIVEEHRGEIEIRDAAHSDVDRKGATVWLSFPIRHWQ